MEWSPDVEKAKNGDKDAFVRTIQMCEIAIMDRLESPYKMVAVLYYYGDLSVKEIAAELSLPEGTVKSRLHRAREFKLEGFLHDAKVMIEMDPSTIKVGDEAISSTLGGVSKEVIGGTMATVLHFTRDKALPNEFTLGIRIVNLSLATDGGIQKLNGDWSFQANVVQLTNGVLEQRFEPPITRSFLQSKFNQLFYCCS